MQFKATLPDAELRRKLQDKVNEIRAEKIDAPVEFNGHDYDADPQSVANLTGVVASLGAGIPVGDVVWRDANNVDVTHSPESLVALAGTMLARNQAVYAASFTIKNAIAEAEDPSTVDINSGWPAA